MVLSAIRFLIVWNTKFDFGYLCWEPESRLAASTAASLSLACSLSDSLLPESLPIVHRSGSVWTEWLWNTEESPQYEIHTDVNPLFHSTCAPLVFHTIIDSSLLYLCCSFLFCFLPPPFCFVPFSFGSSFPFFSLTLSAAPLQCSLNEMGYKESFNNLTQEDETGAVWAAELVLVSLSSSPAIVVWWPWGGDTSWYTLWKRRKGKDKVFLSHIHLRLQLHTLTSAKINNTTHTINSILLTTIPLKEEVKKQYLKFLALLRC